MPPYNQPCQHASAVGEIDKQLVKPQKTSSPPKDPSQSTVLAVKPSMLIQLWEAWRREGHASFDRISEAQLCVLWCSVAHGSAWSEIEIQACLMAVRHRLQIDATLKAVILEDGSIDARFDRWLHYILLERGASRVKSTLDCLCKILVSIGAAPQEARPAADPVKLHKLHLELAAKDLDMCKRCSMSEWLRMYHVALCMGDQASSDSSVQNTDDFVSQGLTGLGLRGDEALTYAEFLSMFLGRVESDVTLYMYDISDGAARAVNVAEAIWHTSVEVFGVEYYYNGKCVHVEPGESCFGKPKKRLWVGSTLCRKSEFHNFCVQQLADTFTTESYDLVRKNCNHFSDKILHFLCGAEVPNDIMHQTDALFKVPGMETFWPVVASWVTRFVTCPGVSEVLSRETSSSSIDLTDADSCHKAQSVAALDTQQASAYLRSDDASSSTVATDTGGERSTSIGDGDSGMDSPATQRSSPSVAPVCADAKNEIDSTIDSMLATIQELAELSVPAERAPVKKNWFFNPFSKTRHVQQGPTSTGI